MYPKGENSLFSLGLFPIKLWNELDEIVISVTMSCFLNLKYINISTPKCSDALRFEWPNAFFLSKLIDWTEWKKNGRKSVIQLYQDSSNTPAVYF